jgi:hypothetical protein
MDWQGALRARLIAAAPVTALVAQRVYWVDRPQASALPAITLQTITEDRPQNMAGFDGLDRSLVQLDVWGNSYAQVQQVKEAALAAVIPANTANGIRFWRAFVDSIRDLGEQVETQFIHRASIDLIFHHATA